MKIQRLSCLGVLLMSLGGCNVISGLSGLETDSSLGGSAGTKEPEEERPDDKPDPEQHSGNCENRKFGQGEFKVTCFQ